MKSMDNIDNFDNSDVTMAGETFNTILDQIQSSRLNFQLQLSPFSALISLKKSFIKDKDGNRIIPSSVSKTSIDEEVSMLKDRNRSLEISMRTLQDLHQRTLQEHAKAQDIIESLKTQVQVKTEDKTDELQSRCDLLEDLLLERDQTIQQLKAAETTALKVVNRLNKEIVDNKVQFKEEKAKILQEHRAEVKLWKKELGQANSMVIKLNNVITVGHDSKKGNGRKILNFPNEILNLPHQCQLKR